MHGNRAARHPWSGPRFAEKLLEGRATHLLGVGREFRRKGSQLSFLLGLMVIDGDLIVRVGVVVLDQVALDELGELRRHRHIASRRLQHFPCEVGFVGLARTGR